MRVSTDLSTVEVADVEVFDDCSASNYHDFVERSLSTYRQLSKYRRLTNTPAGLAQQSRQRIGNSTRLILAMVSSALRGRIIHS
jgi:hypothetical protein